MERTVEEIVKHFGRVSTLVVATWIVKRWINANQKESGDEEPKKLKKTTSYKLLSNPESQYELATPGWLRELAELGECGFPKGLPVPEPPQVVDALAKLREAGSSIQLGEEHVLEQMFLLKRTTTKHYLNAGSFGGAYRLAVEAQQWYQTQLEAEPVFFYEEVASVALQAAKARLADYVNAAVEDVVALPNATVAVNTVLASTPLKTGDLLLVTSITYAAVRNAAARFAAKAGAGVVEVALDLETLLQGEGAVLDRFQSVLAQWGGRVRLAVLDHITSAPTFHMPIGRLAALCREHGVKVLVDGAHAVGAVPLDVPAIGAQYYTANLHKWGNSPKSAAFLWVHRSCQAALQPLATSHGYKQGFQGEFAWPGTVDPTAWLAVPAALAVQEALGADRVRRHNHAMLLTGVQLLKDAWGAQLAVTGADAEFSHMASIELPTLPGVAASPGGGDWLHKHLQKVHGVQVPVSFWAGRLWVRISAQIYNTPGDYKALAAAVSSHASET